MILLRRLFVPVVAILVLLLETLEGSNLNPVILVPGDGGSQVEARINKTQVVHYICAKQSDWYDLWLNIEQMVPAVIDCWADNMKLIYDNKTHTTRNNDGVEIRIPGFGNSSTVEFLDPSMNSFSIYFAKVAARLFTLGYERGVNLHGAPYDFRKAANEHAEYFANLKTLVEDTYKRNGNKPVIFICHSMGSPMTLYFLNRQSQAWKDQYVKAFITMAGVWGGTVRAMKVFAVGDNLGAWIIQGGSLMTEQRTNPSLAWLMPSERLWKADEVLVESSNINITVNNLGAFYEAFDTPDAKLMHGDVKDLVRDLTPPGVETFCLHGSGVPTTEKMIYPTFPGSSPVLKTGDGDGTVNIRSLLACTEWEGKQKEKFHHHIFPNVDHLQLLRDDGATEYVKNIVQELLKGEVRLEAETQEMPEIEIIP